MMAPMRSTDVRDDLQDGIDAAPLPPQAPDGGLELTRAEPIEAAPPRLCEAGPCVHYHRLEVQMDAQNPMAERRDGVLIKHARVFHTTIHHYCYPDVGIETNLGSLPVLACNRWVPVMSLLSRITGGRWRARRQYERDVAAWNVARELEAASLAVDAGISTDPVDLTVEVRRQSGGIAMMTTSSFSPDWTIRHVVANTCERDLASIGDWPVGFTVELEDGPIGNLEATINHLGLQPGARVVVTLTSKEIV
jgi:hypothetical protein